MSLFQAIDVAGTGVDAMQTWIDASAGNIANANDATSTNATTYAPQEAVFTPVTAEDADGVGEGVAAVVDVGSDTGIVEPDPTSPQANSSGEVRVPAISLSDQLVSMMEAQEGYQADTSAMSRAIAAYQSGLTIGS